jgi:poly(A) polymerase
MLKWLFGSKKVSPKLPSNFKDLLDSDAVEIVDRLQKAGFETYLVGGCVRDILLNKKPKDFDIATSASPQKVKSLIHRAFVIGKRFRIVIAKRNARESKDENLLFPFFKSDLPEKEFQITTFRRDPIEVDGVINENVFGTAKEDAFRRDFSLNALFLDPSKGRIVDFVKGLDDLSKGHLVVIGDPEVRFKEDPIRMLRAIRFVSRAGLRLEKKCELALIKHISELKNSKRERLREEILKILREGHAPEVFEHLKKLGAWIHVSPALESYFKSAGVWGQTLTLIKTLKVTPWHHPSQSPFIFVAFYPLIENLLESKVQSSALEDLKVSKAEWEDIFKIRWNLKRLQRDPQGQNSTKLLTGHSARNFIWWAQTFFVLHCLADAYPNKFSKLWKVWLPLWKSFSKEQHAIQKRNFYTKKHRHQGRKRSPERENPSSRGGSSFSSTPSVKPSTSREPLLPGTRSGGGNDVD